MYAEYNGNNRASIILSFAYKINEDVNYTLTINKIQDLAGNISQNIKFSFIYHDIHEFDVLINEIMADPEPSVGLPSCEYIELYNSTNHDINIKNWTLQIGNSSKTITQDIDIQSYGYLILCKDDAVSLLSDYGECVGFSSFSIPNTGSDIMLSSDRNIRVHKLIFDKHWYRDNEKSEGGWSLELIDPHSPCLAAENWRASCGVDGGTPGAVNSVDGICFVAPDIDYVNVLNDTLIEVFFNQTMDVYSMSNTENYTIVEFDSHPNYSMPSENDDKSVVLSFSQVFLVHRLYNISVFGLTNCSGQPVLDGCIYAFGLPDEAVGGDVVINEILFDPISPAADYVEIYNCSDKVLNINKLKLGAVKTSFPNHSDTTIKTICSDSRQLLPQTYLLLTTTPEEISSQYNSQPQNVIAMDAFPSYPNSGATALLLYDNNVIDCMSYSEDMHYPLLTVTKGVSIERVSPSVSSDNPDNWHSAATPYYGTPGYQNSVFLDKEKDNENVAIHPTVFSPDGDGFEDITMINLLDFQPGFTAKIKIFDSQGRFVRNLVTANIASQNRFIWNGLDENGKIVPAGIYVVFIETFDIQGVIKRFKKAVVVAYK